MKNIFKNLLFVAILQITISNIFGQVHPAWFNKVQLLQFGKDYTLNPSPILDLAPYTGSGWGIGLPSYSDDNTLKLEIEAWHSRNKIHIAATNFIAYSKLDTPSIPDSHRLQDLNGNFVTNPPIILQYTIFSPLWCDLLFQQLKKAIDLGADGIQIDGVLFPSIMLSWNSQPASFDPLTMAAFREFLKDHYTTYELLTKFDIENIDTFNYGIWIKSHGLQLTWNQTPLRGLAWEFMQFLLLKTKSFIHEIVDYAHNYALNNYGRLFTLSSNPTFVTLGYFLLDETDYLLNEHFEPYLPFLHSEIRAMKCIKDWPVVVLPEPTNENLPKTTKNMIKLIIANIYSSGGFMCFGEALSEGLGKPINIDLNIFARYMNFIIPNSHLYENLSYRPQVAIINSMASRTAQHWPIEGSAYADNGFAMLGIGNILMDSNIQFDFIFAPDSRFTTIPSFTLTQLQKYKVIVLPNTFALTDDQVQTLLEYIKNGGTIVATGYIGTNNPDGTLANRTELLSLQQGEGVKTYGVGKFVYNPISLGEVYLWDLSVPHSTVRQQFQAMILPYIQPEIKTYNISEVYRPGGATGFLYQDSYGNYILHLVNYDFNEYTDNFSVKENFILKILADTTKSWQAVYVSPDFLGQQVLPTTNDSGYVKMTIPKLEAYGIIILQENQTAPQIVSRTPSNNLTILAGDSVHFSVHAKDLDNNPIFYQWYVNGHVDSIATDTIYSYRTNRTAEGLDTIRVEISDGYHQVTSQWQVTIQSYNFPKILFDETHHPRNSSLWYYAMQINPEHPDWNSYKKMADRLSKDYIVSHDTTASLTLSELRDANILVFTVCNDDISYQERTAIQQFVNEGGGILFIGEIYWWWATEASNGNISKLLQDFGFKTNFNPVRSLVDTLWSSSVFYLKLTGSHPATTGVGNILFESGHKVEITKVNAQIIETTGELPVWQDINSNGKRDDNEPFESNIGIVGISEYDKGKAVYISYARFSDDRIDATPNFKLISSVMKWLTADLNVVVPVELAYFTAVATNNQAELNWSTATETNNFSFEIQRSQDKINFIKVGFVAGNQTTTMPHKYSFIDRNINVGTCYYRLKQIDNNGSYKYSPTVQVSVEIPKTFELSQNYPNPFNPNTIIKYQLPKSELVSITIYNVLGQKVKTLISENQNAGYYTVNWDGKSDNSNDVASGVYIYCLRTKNFVKSLKMVLIR